MNKKIINIIIFTVAAIGCLLALWFAIRFDDAKKENYDTVSEINKVNPRLIADFKATSLEQLPQFVEKNQAELTELNKELKNAQLQRDIFYTYIHELKSIDETTFADYKANFPAHALALFAKADKPEKYIQGFNALKGYDDLLPYIYDLDSEYAGVKQAYLEKKEYAKSLGGFLAGADKIISTTSASKKATEYSALQSDVKSFLSEGRLINCAVVFLYVIFAIAILLIVAFSLYYLIVNIKSSYKALLGIALIAVLVLLGYVLSSGELSKSAIANGLTSQTVKWIGAGCITTYIALFAAILSILVAWFIGKFIKKV
ncbi:MAG: hypothetical protein LBR51_03310 [Bacteroidales bacterium]|jgi:hypothetical protein|nr:hypothetical protein [Bacteroidales bacterium]